MYVQVMSHVCFCFSENVQLMRLSPKMDLHLELPCCWAAELILKCILFHGSLFSGQISALTHTLVVVTKHNMMWAACEIPVSCPQPHDVGGSRLTGLLTVNSGDDRGTQSVSSTDTAPAVMRC